MDFLINNPYLDRPIQKRYSRDSLPVVAPKPPEQRKAKRKLKPIQQPSTEEPAYQTARERREAEEI